MAIVKPEDKVKALADKYLKASKTAPLSGAIVAHGPPCSGKTRFAATASEHFPEKTGEKWVALSDVLFLTFDQGALDGLKVEKLDVAFVDARAMVAEMGAVKATFEALQLVDGYLQEHPEVRFIVIDTISEMAELWGEGIGRTTDDKWAIFRLLGETHTRFHAMVNKICTPRGVVPIYLSHSKARTQGSDTTEAQKKSAQAERLPGGNDIGLDVDGQGRGTYTRNASLLFAVRCKQLAGKEPIYEVLPRGGDGFEGKDRLARILQSSEPSNLRRILQKIESSLIEK